MSKIAELKANIEKVEKVLKNPRLEEKFRPSFEAKLKKYKSELAELENEAEKPATPKKEAEKPAEKSNVAELKANIEKVEKALKNPRLEEKFRPNFEAKLKKYKSELAELEAEKPAAKRGRKPAAEKSEPKKKEAKQGKVVVLDGKEYTESDKDFCDKLLAKWNERRAAAKKAQKKHKTKSVFEVMTSKLDGIVNTIVKNVAANPSEARTHVVINRLEKVEEIFKRMFADLKTVLGDDFDKDEAKEFLSGIHEMVTKFKEKVEAKKDKK
jgi:hypothetical protein